MNLRQLTSGTPYVAYAYSYPHKTAYRPLRPVRPLREVWRDEPRDAVYLYLHVPFCEMRCGFCNLFTTANPNPRLASDYLDAIERQARRVRSAVGDVRIARAAIGGGTPTFLDTPQLSRLLSIMHRDFGVCGGDVPISVETSPRTADREKLALLREFGVERISIGVQSFVEAEVNASGRAQKNPWVESAIERIRGLGFAVLNLDLIYGLPGQTVGSWMTSLTEALRSRPQEIYLYPLYVRPLTGLDRWGTQPEDELRQACYRNGRDLLVAEGYEQISMRMFRRHDTGSMTDAATEYACQSDGMIGLGCGARSYTRSLHYSTDYAVGAEGVRQIIGDFIARTDAGFDVADYGCELDVDEQRRRWVIKSFLRSEGIDLDAYERHFGSDAIADHPELSDLVIHGLALREGRRLRPTADGLERSDAIGPWLFSSMVQRTMGEFALR